MITQLVSTKDVIDHHLKCFGERDIQGVLSDYAPDAVMFTANGALRGVDAIRQLLQAMIDLCYFDIHYVARGTESD